MNVWAVHGCGASFGIAMLSTQRVPPLLRNEVGVLIGVVGLTELHDEVAAVAVGNSGIAGHQQLVVLVGVERGDTRQRIGHQRLCFGQLVLAGRVERVPEVLERSAHRLARIVQQGRCLPVEAVLRGDISIEDQAPRLGHVFAGHRQVDTETGGAPLVWRRVRAVGIERKTGCELGQQIAQVRNRVLVQRLDVARVDHDRHHVVGRHDEVVTRSTGVDDRLHRLVRVVVVLGDLDAEFCGERVFQLGVHVLGPVVDGERTIGLAGFTFRCGRGVVISSARRGEQCHSRHCSEKPHQSFQVHCFPPGFFFPRPHVAVPPRARWARSDNTTRNTEAANMTTETALMSGETPRRMSPNT